jgi:uncharacterized HAD superfamily protein
MHKTIALDLDGVCYDFGNALYTELVSHNKIDCSYDFFWKNTNQFSDAWWDNMVKVDTLYSSQVPGRDTLSLLNDLNKQYKIYYISGRPQEVYFTTQQYLKRYRFPQRNNLVFTHNKGEVCNRLGVTLMVEDQAKYVSNLIKCGVQVIIRTQPWNEDWYFPCERINSFSELRRILC